MNLELLLIPIIFLLSLVLLKVKLRSAITLLLFLSILLHKEVFSIYTWDVLPVRLFMLALGFYAFILVVQYFLKKKSRLELADDVKRFFSDPFIFSLCALWLAQAVSIIFTKNLQSSVNHIAFFSTIVVLGIFLYKSFKNDTIQLTKYINVYIKFAFLACLFGFLQVYIYFVSGLTIGALWSVPGHTPRVGSTFWDVNHFGAFLAGLLPVLGVFIITESTWKKRIMNFVMFIVMLSVLLLTNSRSAWIMAVVSFLTFVSLLLFRWLRLKGVALLFGVLLLLSIPLIREYSIKSSPFRARIKNYFHYRIDSFDSHILLLQGTYEVFSKYPILGGGYGSFYEHFSKTEISSVYFGRDPAALNTRVPAHTIWGELIAETGLIGLSMFMVLMFVMIGSLLYVALNSGEMRQVLTTTAMVSVFFGWLTAGIFYSYKSEFFWLVLFLYFIYAVSILKSKFNFLTLFNFFIRSEKFPVVALLLLSFMMIFWGIWATHLIPWDEAIYAEIAKNIYTSGDFLTLRWTNLWFEKPPLAMWMMSLCMKLFGISSFAVRLPTALLGIGTVVLTYKFGKLLFNKTTGFLAALVLLTTTQFVYYSRTAMLDVSATFFITLALYMYWKARSSLRVTHWVLAGVSVGLAVLTKGVVGFLPIVIILICELIWHFSGQEHISKRKFKGYLVAVVSSLVVFLPWHLLMIYKYGKAFVDSYIVYHVLQRATMGIEDKGRPIYWYFVVLKVSMRIWFVALILALPYYFASSFEYLHRKLSKYIRIPLNSPMETRFLLIYSLVILTFFSVSASKLVWYIIPVYPVLAILIGAFLEKIFRTLTPASVLRRFMLLYAFFIIVMLYFFSVRELTYPGDLTYKQAELLKLKDELYDTDTLVYVDRIELPLVLFYSDSPFEIVDFGPLEEKLNMVTYTDSVIFITKESRFRKYSESHPNLRLDKQIDEWVLGYLPSEREIDKKAMSDLNKDITELNLEIVKLNEAGLPIPSSMMETLRQQEVSRVKLQEKIDNQLMSSSKDR